MVLDKILPNKKGAQRAFERLQVATCRKKEIVLLLLKKMYAFSGNTDFQETRWKFIFFAWQFVMLAL